MKDIQAFKELMNSYTNWPFIEYLVKEITKGFGFNFTSTRVKKVQENLKSLDLNLASFKDYIQDEIRK
ncbi:22807_t:CDS:1, partial [Gigaspora rosea]